MDDPHPSLSPESLEALCRDVPALRHQIDELAHDQQKVSIRTVQIDDRNRAMAANIAELSYRQQVLHGQMTKLTAQMQQILDSMRAIGGTESNFQRLAQDVGGSVRMGKRLWKLLIAVAAGLAALYAAFHIGESKGGESIEAPVHEDAPAEE